MSSKTVISPGERLRIELKDRGIKQKDFAKKIEIPYTMLNKFINGNRPVKADFALLLEKSLEIDADYWLNLQARYNLYRARNNAKLMEMVNRISKI
jgi:HTH-type transcriptional regulator/antitoxin HigA